MKHYLRNVWAWLRGFAWLWDEDRVGGWKRGWGPWKFLPVYALNVGSHVVLSGGAVTTWSRAFYDWRQSGSAWGKRMDRWVQAVLGDDHGKNSGPVLWGTTPCDWRVRVAAALAWAVVLL
jgi:hypothetical protein